MGMFRLILVALGTGAGSVTAYRAASGGSLVWVIGALVAVAGLAGACAWRILKHGEEPE
jgi:hypothetical protein